ncbi:MAG: hypothetical protein HY782_18295 [Chloroflexi bacterium]|nr:hypothetical protein [Chloroflexota bacterium]
MRKTPGEAARVKRPRAPDMRTLGDPKQLAPKFQRLAQTIAAAPDIHPRAPLSHEDCQALLEFYVDSEKRGENARALYPGISKHLKTCADCQMTYDSLTEALSEPASRDFTLPSNLKFDLPFLVHSQPNAPSSKYVHSRVAGGPLRFGVIVNSKTIGSALASSAQFALPGERGESATEGSLLFLDSFALGRRSVDVELRMRPVDAHHARLDISVVPSTPLPEPLRISLYLNDEPYPAALEHGRGSTGEISLAKLENAQIRVEFEVSLSSTDTEG